MSQTYTNNDLIISLVRYSNNKDMVKIIILLFEICLHIFCKGNTILPMPKIIFGVHNENAINCMRKLFVSPDVGKLILQEGDSTKYFICDEIYFIIEHRQSYQNNCFE